MGTHQGAISHEYLDYYLDEFTVMDETKLAEIEIEKLKQLLKEDFDDCIAQVVKAIDSAKAGSIIDDSEEPVRAATSNLRQKIFQKALQLKINAADAAFSPSSQDKK